MAPSTTPPKPKPVPRRRRPDSKTVKKTFTLAEETVRLVTAAVREGGAENLSAYVEAAIEEKLRRSRRDDLYDAYKTASHDAHFMADMRGVAKDFKRAVADGLRDD
ncbi:MAG: hypothetical protein ACYC3F_08620 [Gemmatimonadaceae bacterium]